MTVPTVWQDLYEREYPRLLRALAAMGGDADAAEDAAQEAGATLHGRRLGSFGDLSVLSFGRGKGVTGGGGGALLYGEPMFAAASAAFRRRDGERSPAGAGWRPTG